MSINQRLLILLAGLALAGCQTDKLVKVPEKIYIPVEKYVNVPKELTEPCPIALPQNYTVDEAVRIAKARKTSLEKCNEDKDKIRRIGGTEVP